LIGPATAGVDFAFLEACFKAGLLEYWSAVSVHPYRQTDPETVIEDYCRLRQLIATYAPLVRTRSGSDEGPVTTPNNNDSMTKQIPIVSGEWGYSSAWRGMNEAKQGEGLARQWLTNAANGVQLSIWYDWHDDGQDPNDAEHHFGTVSNASRAGVDSNEMIYDPKPAYLAAKTLTSFFDGYSFVKRVEVGGATDYVLLFRKENETRLAAWTTSIAHNVVIKTNAPDFKLIPVASSSRTEGDALRFITTTHLGKAGPPITAHGDSLAITLTNAPQYLGR